MHKQAPYTAFEFLVRSGSALGTNLAVHHAANGNTFSLAATSAIILATFTLEYRRSHNQTPWRHQPAAARLDRATKAGVEGAALGAALGGLGTLANHALPAAQQKIGQMADLLLR